MHPTRDRAAVTPLLRSTLLALSLLAAATAATAVVLVPASGAYSLCPDETKGPCVERDGACASAVHRFTYDFAAGAGSCPTVAAGPHGAGACESAWAGAGGYGGFFGALVAACGTLDSEGNGCVTPYVQVNEDGSTFKPVCLA